MRDMKERCSICGCTYNIFAFKSGFVCEDCLNYLKGSFEIDAYVRSSMKK